MDSAGKLRRKDRRVGAVSELGGGGGGSGGGGGFEFWGENVVTLSELLQG